MPRAIMILTVLLSGPILWAQEVEVVDGADIRESAVRYLVLNIHGEIGLNVRTDIMTDALEVVQRVNPDILVLHIDSSGGNVSEKVQIIDALSLWRSESSTRVVAFVERALSAAAFIALTCEDIYMMPTGIIGSAMMVPVDQMGLVRQILKTGIVEMMASSLRAKNRFAVHTGNHDPLWIEALSVPKSAIYIRVIDGKPQLRKLTMSERIHLRMGRDVFANDDDADVDSPEDRTDDVKWQVLADKDKLLTLDASEAVDYGLARGIAKDYQWLARDMGFDGWVLASDELAKLQARQARQTSTVIREWNTQKDVQKSVSLRSLPNSRSSLSKLKRRRHSLGKLIRMATEYPWLDADMDALKSANADTQNRIDQMAASLDRASQRAERRR